jgi:hypothetical protein
MVENKKGQRVKTGQYRGRSKDAPALWAAQRKYEEKHEKPEVKADEEMDVGV